mgnify:CR=1 FL=1
MKKKQEGFTLIELIIVIAILAIIAAIAIPNILGAIDNSRKATDVANAKIIMNAAAQVKAQDPDAVAADVDFGATLTGFGADIEAQLNGDVPTPKYRPNDADAFELEISGDDMSIITGLGQVLPTPSSNYVQD